MIFLIQNNEVKHIKPIKPDLFRVCVCPSGGLFLPAAHIFGQRYVKNIKFGTVVVHHKSFWKKHTNYFLVFHIFTYVNFFCSKIENLITIFKETNLLLETTRFFNSVFRFKSLTWLASIFLWKWNAEALWRANCFIIYIFWF